MSHQDGLGNNGAEATGLTKPDDGDDRMQKKSENVAHGRNGIKLDKLENSGHLRNSPTTRPDSRGRAEQSGGLRRTPTLVYHWRPDYSEYPNQMATQPFRRSG